MAKKAVTPPHLRKFTQAFTIFRDLPEQQQELFVQLIGMQNKLLILNSEVVRVALDDLMAELNKMSNDTWKKDFARHIELLITGCGKGTGARKTERPLSSACGQWKNCLKDKQFGTQT